MRRLACSLGLVTALSQAELGAKNAEDAAQELARLDREVAKNPSSARTWYELAHARSKAGLHEVAVSAYRAYMTLKPEDPDPYYGLGKSLQALGKKSEAADAFRTYIAREKRREAQASVAKAKLALAALEGGPFAEGDRHFAARRYREAVQAYGQEPGQIDAHYRAGVAHAAQGDLQAAIAAWERVLFMNPTHERARRNIELSRARLDRDQSVQPAETVVLEAGRKLLAEGRALSAAAALEPFVRGAPSEAALALRAQARLAMGDAAGAVADWESILAADGRSLAACRGLSEAWQALDQPQRARFFAELVLRRGGDRP